MFPPYTYDDLSRIQPDYSQLPIESPAHCAMVAALLQVAFGLLAGLTAVLAVAAHWLPAQRFGAKAGHF